MPDPVLHIVAGPNGAGKTTFYDRILQPATRLGCVNADLIAEERWPDSQMEHAYEAATAAAEERTRRFQERQSFVTETVFSHPSKVTLVRQARHAGYMVVLHIIMIPEQLAVARVVNRVENGGHDVPETKVRARYQRLWRHIREAIATANEAHAYDNTKGADPFRLIATYRDGHLTGTPRWPAWTPPELQTAD